MADLDKVLKGLEHCKKHGSLCGNNCSGHYERYERYTEDGYAIKLVGDYRSTCPYKDDDRGCVVGLTDDAFDLLKSQHAWKEKLLRNIADQQLAVSPTGYETEEGLAKRTGEWNGLQIAYEIVEHNKLVENYNSLLKKKK